MTAEERPPLDASTILEPLNRHGVDYLVIGAWAVEAQGIRRTTPTRDVDVTPDRCSTTGPKGCRE